MDTDGGRWTVILRRRRNVFPNVNFNRPWDDYENGFGDLNTEFWLGMRNIHCLTTKDDVNLLIDPREADGNGMTWIYHKFKVDGSNEKYRLHIGEAEGPPHGYDAMAYHDGMLFTTTGNDNDLSGNNCAIDAGGGWWFNSCYRGFLTGAHTDSQTWQRLLWYSGIAPIQTSTFNYYQDVEMKIRPKACPSRDSECTKEEV